MNEYAFSCPVHGSYLNPMCSTCLNVFRDRTVNAQKQLEHTHNFVIPVEFKEVSHSFDEDGGRFRGNYVVTKLRCECGEEMERQ